MIKKIEKYGASWCAPCKVLYDTLQGFKDKVEIIEYDADENNDKFEEMQILSVPTLVFKDDQDVEVDRIKGAIGASKIQEILDKYE